MYVCMRCRVFTTIQEVGLDLSLLSGFLLNALLTGVQLLQVTSMYIGIVYQYIYG